MVMPMRADVGASAPQAMRPDENRRRVAITPAATIAQLPWPHLGANLLLVAIVLPAPVSLVLAVLNGFVTGATAAALILATGIGYAVGRHRQLAACIGAQAPRGARPTPIYVANGGQGGERRRSQP